MNGLLRELMLASRFRQVQPAPTGKKAGKRASLCQALRGRDRLSLLAEFKRQSPSDARLALHVDLCDQVRGYEQCGAAGISVLTEPTRFGGSLADLQLAALQTALPILRKDFLVRPEQVREASAHGASAVLLIARCLVGMQLQELVHAARAAGVEFLIECHDEADVARALPFEDAMLGINNRDLDSLRVDRSVSLRLAAGIPSDRVVVAESGYLVHAHLEPLVGIADAVLVGTALMRGDAVRLLRGLSSPARQLP